MILRKTTLLLLGVVLTFIGFCQSAPTTFQNPIISGYHPDPSVCRVGDDYYLVNSTFVWFPGLPIYHSKDLVNWELIGHAVDRPDMIDLDGLPDKLGLFAPTIRHHDGLFYIINTCVGCKMNFYITATDPAGPWSDPIWLPEAPGIDPSLFWDDDGTCYYTGMTGVENQLWPGHCMIFNQELDLDQQKLIGERHDLTTGHANNASYAEGPHLYKIDGKYLLMVSEGGTGMFHSIAVHHSDSANGPYVSDHINPVISHRHLGADYPVHAIGHGDLFQTQNDEWWCVMLGKRRIDHETTLGRETFLAKVTFEGSTPIFNAGHGCVLMEQERPNLPWTPVPEIPVRDEFDGEKLSMYWNTIRSPKETYYTVEDGELNMNLRPVVMDSLVNSSLLLQRIEHHHFKASTKMNFKSKKRNERAGLTIYRTNENYFQLVREGESVVLIQSFIGEVTELARIPYTDKTVVFAVEGNELEVEFKFGANKDQLQNIGGLQSLIVISDDKGNTQFNGPGVGVYATSQGLKTKEHANFEWFDYEGIKK